ncbi:hypothetical protein H4Q26_006938 [Puccinia striiformis f. sp. tritici PST-130]|uniref:Uncharacterized protein n=1 Tax=Puccinia striiformis f. sp. tritici PST-78 TaxID=1165861 RepID=A0A0L0VCX8_9BASI|nr:hypothetical protein H4Q26_006938 [Puccinia striiformis f. sp. tritici PST-130]KNE96839.1 hypothetical protein PSTG_09822 [Puccinia striiformis f. sp. tritici PST-78]
MTPHHTAELEAMKSGYQEIKNRVNLLDKPLTVPFYQVVPRMRQLHSSLKPQIQERVFRLSGVGSPFTSLQLNTVNEHAEHISGTAPLTIGTDSLVPIVARSSKDESSPITGSQASERPTGRSSFRTIATIKNTLQYLNKLSSCMTTRKEPSSVASSILSDSPLEPTMIQQTTLREDSATTRPFGKSQTGETARSPHILANRAMGKAARSEILVPQAGRNTDAMNEARLARPKGIIINQNLPYSNSLRETTVGPHSEDHAPRETSYIAHYLLHPNEAQNQPAGHYPSTGPSVLNHGEKTTRASTVLETNLVRSGIQLGRLAIDRGSARGELHGDVLDVVKGFLADDKIQIMWNYVEAKLLFFSSRKFKPSNREEGKYLLEFLQSLFLFSDYIYTYRLLPPQFLKNIKISRLPYISSIIELQVKTMFLKNREFFHATESMIPQMDFLTTGPSLKHLHRSMKAIPSQHHIYLVRPALREIFHLTNLFDTTNISNLRFKQIRTRFCRGTFFNVARQLSSALREAPDMDYRARDEYLSVVSLIDDMIKFFQDPPRGELPTDKDRVEFQIIFYSLDFFDKYFQPIMGAMKRTQMIPQLFEQQLDYMRSFLKFFQNQLQDPSLYQYFKKDRTFMKMYRDRSAENESLRQWIKIVPLTLFYDIKIPSLFGIRRSPKFSMWMCKRI